MTQGISLLASQLCAELRSAQGERGSVAAAGEVLCEDLYIE